MCQWLPEEPSRTTLPEWCRISLVAVSWRLYECYPGCAGLAVGACWCQLVRHAVSPIAVYCVSPLFGVELAPPLRERNGLRS